MTGRTSELTTLWGPRQRAARWSCYRRTRGRWASRAPNGRPRTRRALQRASTRATPHQQRLRPGPRSALYWRIGPRLLVSVTVGGSQAPLFILEFGHMLHRHPCPEAFVVKSGQATFRIGDRTVVVDAFHVVGQPPGEAHVRRAKIASSRRELHGAHEDADAAARRDPEVTTMPRSVEENLDHPSEPDEAEVRRPDESGVEVYVALREAVTAREAAEHAIAVAVNAARAHGVSWATIGILLGTSGEAVEQRYGQ